MKYPHIHSLVPAGEHFDESAILNEGGWVSTGHLTNIESSIAEFATKEQGHADAIQLVQNSLDGSNKTIEELNGTITKKDETIVQLQGSVEENNKTISTKDARITELEAQVKQLGSQSSGTGTTVGAKVDERVKETVGTASSLPRYDSPDHPANQAADKVRPSRSL